MDVVFAFGRNVESILEYDVETEIRTRSMAPDGPDAVKFRGAVADLILIVQEADLFGYVFCPQAENEPARIRIEEALARLGLNHSCVAALGDETCPSLEGVKAVINAAHPDLTVII